MNEKFCILIQISLKFVPKDPIDNKSVLVQVMAWRRTGDEPVSEAMLTQFTNAYAALGEIFFIPLIIIFFRITQTLVTFIYILIYIFIYIYNDTFIFDGRQRSWTPVTPDKYGRDVKYLTYTFVNGARPSVSNIVPITRFGMLFW